MKRFFLLLVAMSLTGMAGCATNRQLTAAQEDYLQTAMATPLTFTLPRDQAEEAWARAQSFVTRFSTMKLQSLTPHVIRTYDPTEATAGFGYYLRRIPRGDRTKITVECMCNNLMPSDQSVENAHILAYYMRTGKLDATLVNR